MSEYKTSTGTRIVQDKNKKVFITKRRTPGGGRVKTIAVYPRKKK